jgi:hypothetical protein
VQGKRGDPVLQLWNVDCSSDRSLDPTIYRLCLKDPLQVYDVKSAQIAPGFSSGAHSVDKAHE